MELKNGDIIYIESFKDDIKNHYCKKHFKDLIGFPTRVTKYNNNLYVSHPIFSIVPLYENCVNYELIEDITIESQKESQEFLATLKNLGVSKVPKKSIKNLFKESLNEQSENEGMSNTDKKLLDILKSIEKGEIDTNILDHFGGEEKFVSILEKRNLLKYADPFNYNSARFYGSMLNDMQYRLLKQNPNSYDELMSQLRFNDVQKVGNDYYAKMDYYDLKQLFSNVYSTEYGIENILSGNYDEDYDDSYYEDPYYIYSVLGDATNYVDNKIVLELRSEPYLNIKDESSELFHEIMDEQGNDGEIKITNKVINQIMEDEESIQYLIRYEFTEIKDNLIKLFKDCEKSLISNSTRGKLFNELIKNNIIDDYTPKFFKTTNRFGGKSEIITFKITNSLKKHIMDFLKKSVDEGYYYSIFDIDDYQRLLRDTIKSMVIGNSKYVIKKDELITVTNDNVESCMEENVKYYF